MFNPLACGTNGLNLRTMSAFTDAAAAFGDVGSGVAVVENDDNSQRSATMMPSTSAASQDQNQNNHGCNGDDANLMIIGDRAQPMPWSFSSLPWPSQTPSQTSASLPSSQPSEPDQSMTVSTPDILRFVQADNNTPKHHFPHTLHRLVEEADDAIVSWVDDGTAFRIHDRDAFMEAASSYFKLKKFRSFTRQLNIWGFTYFATGPSKGQYQHPSFVRGKAWLCRNMTREKSSRCSKKKQQVVPPARPNTIAERTIPNTLHHESNANANADKAATSTNASLPEFMAAVAKQQQLARSYATLVGDAILQDLAESTRMQLAPTTAPAYVATAGVMMDTDADIGVGNDVRNDVGNSVGRNDVATDKGNATMAPSSLPSLSLSPSLSSSSPAQQQIENHDEESEESCSFELDFDFGLDVGVGLDAAIDAKIDIASESGSDSDRDRDGEALPKTQTAAMPQTTAQTPAQTPRNSCNRNDNTSDDRSMLQQSSLQPSTGEEDLLFALVLRHLETRPLNDLETMKRWESLGHAC